MRYQDLIRKSWQLTQEHHYLNIWGILMALFTLLVGVLRLRYFFTDPAITVMTIWEYIQGNFENPVFVMIIVEGTWLSIYLFSFIVSNLSDGALIASIAKIESQQVRLSFTKSLALGLHSLLRVIEYNMVTSLFKISHLIVYILLIRFQLKIYMDGWDFWGENYIWLIPILIFVAILSLFMTYGEYDLIIHKRGVFKSIRNSINLVIFHLSETLLMTTLLLLITIRTILNIVLIFVVPALVASLISYLSINISMALAIGVGSTVALIIFWFSVKISGALHIFTTALWTMTYLDLDSRKDHKILATEKDEHE